MYTFSTENWTRPDDEVSGLFGLIDGAVRQYTDELIEEGVRVRVIGRLHEAPSDVQRSIRAAQDRTAGGDRLTLNICFNYSGRAEIVDAARAMLAGHADPNEITEPHFAEHLYTAGQPDVDLLIRTGGDQRTSNFLLWQAAYAELVFCAKYWPDFEVGDFDAALAAAQELARRGSHVLVNSLNPYRRIGQTTAVLEIVEELGGPPDAFVLPYGGGGNTSAYAQALGELGLRTPIVSVEAETRRETLATAIRIGDPVHAQAVGAAGARVLQVSDDEIVSAWRSLASQEGVFCEPSSAAGLAAVLRGDVDGDRLVVTITGHGLKDTAIADRLAPAPVEVDPDPDAIAAAARDGRPGG